MKWWYGCKSYVTSTKTEDRACHMAKTMDTLGTCSWEHYYWQAEKRPALSSEDLTFQIPKEAKRP